MPAEKPKIFVSHAWKDKNVVRRLEKALRRADVDVWVDHSEMRAGDLITERVNAALEWCDILVLIWSRSARNSDWVAHEWGSAFANRKKVIPCLMDNESLPALLTNTAHVDLRIFEQGTTQLLRSISFASSSVDRNSVQISRRIYSGAGADTIRHYGATVTVLFVLVTIIGVILFFQSDGDELLLRHLPSINLQDHLVEIMLAEKNFFDLLKNKAGVGIENRYEQGSFAGNNVVIDHATGLAWQYSGSGIPMDYEKAIVYVDDLKRRLFAGYYDWRLPTLEEAMSLMEPVRRYNYVDDRAVFNYIEPVFDFRQRFIWTYDTKDDSLVWVVLFHSGNCGLRPKDGLLYVRAVCSTQSLFAINSGEVRRPIKVFE